MSSSLSTPQSWRCIDDHAGASPSLTSVTAFGCSPDEAALFRDLSPHHEVALHLTDEALSETTADLASSSRCISINHKTQVNRTTLLALREFGVEYLSTRSVGDNHIDLDAAESIGIRVGTVAYSPDSVADHTLMTILMSLRDMKGSLHRVAEHDYRLPAIRGRELRDLTVGVIGTGRIGSAVITRLRGFGCRILTHDTRVLPAGPDALPADNDATLDDLLCESDVITLHAPLTPQTHHLLDRRRISRMKPGAVIINTARGPLIDSAALLDALECGHLGGAALDVIEDEEGVFYTDHRNRTPAHPLLIRMQALPHVIVTPHTAYYTGHALRDTVENTLINCRDYEKGMHA